MAPFAGGPETQWTLTVDHHGRVLASTAGDEVESTAVGMATASAADELASAGVVAHLGELELWSVRGSKQCSVTGVSADALLVVATDQAKGTTGVEKALQAWRAAARPETPAAPPPLPPRAARAPTSPDLERAWAALRRALVRGQLTEASARFREVARGLTEGSPEAGEAERAMQRLLQGIGSVLAGDGVAGFETLAPVAAADHRIPSLRWAALQWSAWAALRSNRVPLAVEHASAALELAGQLDSEAIAVSQITAADIVAIGGDSTRAIAWLTEARSRFESLTDAWGVAQTWLHESRVHARDQRENEATNAARRAWAARRDWDEPPLFLAHRSLLRGDHGGAAEIIKGLTTPAADRIRALIEAVRAGTAAQSDVSSFLEVQDAPPSASAIRALGELASRSPRFVQAREALAWMLLKCGRYADAGAVFRALLGSELTQGDRASVLLGLGCVAQAGQKHEAAATTGKASEPAPTPVPGRADGGITADAVFSGQLSLFPLPDVLEFLRTARRSGVLACSSPGGMAALTFRVGAITRAACSGAPTAGEILVAAKKVSREALAAAAAAVSNGTAATEETAIAALVRQGQLDAATVRLAVTRQIELVIRMLVQWKNGEFAFNQDTSEGTTSPWAVALDPQGILLEVFRQLDEGSRDQGAEATL